MVPGTISKIGNLEETLVVVNHEWQSGSLMGRKVVGVVFFGVLAMVAAATSPTTAGRSVV